VSKFWRNVALPEMSPAALEQLLVMMRKGKIRQSIPWVDALKMVEEFKVQAVAAAVHNSAHQIGSEVYVGGADILGSGTISPERAEVAYSCLQEILESCSDSERARLTSQCLGR
jgi:hypothetical protein